jgi:hypothetical protein
MKMLVVGAVATMAMAVTAVGVVDASAKSALGGTYFKWVTGGVPSGCRVLGSKETKGPLVLGDTKYVIGIGPGCPKYLKFKRTHRVRRYESFSAERFVFKAFDATGSYRIVYRKEPFVYRGRLKDRD